MFKAPEFDLLLITIATLELIFPDFWERIMDFRLDPLPDAKTQRFKFSNLLKLSTNLTKIWQIVNKFIAKNV